MTAVFPAPDFSQPLKYAEFLSYIGVIDDIYKAMANPDQSEVVMTVMDIMRKTHTMPKYLRVLKSEKKSNALRDQGNAAYGKENYQEALECYNTALLFAPSDSRALKLAYSNRSALLYHLKHYSKCLKDIEKVFSLGCPGDIADKLRKRHENAKSVLWMERLETDHVSFSVIDFFDFNVRKNSQIPCASADVDVVVEDKVPRVVAATDVKVGAILAIETAFVNAIAKKNSKVSCYYCQKFDMNLVPCHQCCRALFCSEECRDACLKEYHSVECQIIDVLEMMTAGGMSVSVTGLAVKAVLKILHLSKKWKEFITESQLMGNKRLRQSSVNNIFDLNHKYSLLNTKDERHFMTGAVYNTSFICAATIHYLETVANIFPQKTDEKLCAQRAFARMLMFMNLYCRPTEAPVAVSTNQTVSTNQKRIDLSMPNMAFFPFIGKLRHCCRPNTVMVNLNKRMALMASQPIKQGDELTASCLDFWRHHDKQSRRFDMQAIYGMVCNCVLCSGEHILLSDTPLSDMQKKSFRKLDCDMMKEKMCQTSSPDIFAKACKTMALLNSVPFSKEYAKTYSLFRTCLMCFQDVVCNNKMLASKCCEVFEKH